MNAREMNTRELSDLELDVVSAGKTISLGLFGTLKIWTVSQYGANDFTLVRWYPAK